MGANELGGLFAIGAVLLLIVLIIGIVSYVITGIVLSKLNKLMYGHSTALAWIPIANYYLLGKLTFDEKVGWGLVAGILLVNTVLRGVTALALLFNIGVFGLFIYAVVKYFKLKKEVEMGYGPQQMNYQQMNNQPMNNQPMNNQPMNNQPMNNQPMNNQPMNNQPMNNQPMNHQPMNNQPMNNQPNQNNSGQINDPLP